MKNSLFTLSLLSLVLQVFPVTAQNRALHARDFIFDFYFARLKNDTTITCSLLAQPYERMQQSENAVHFISNWLMLHPNARVLGVGPIASHGDNSSVSTITYCWLIDQKDTLNLDLIKNGCFKANTMQVSSSGDIEKMNTEKSKSGKQASLSKEFVNEAAIQRFKAASLTAELYAQENKLGLWLKPRQEEGE